MIYVMIFNKKKTIMILLSITIELVKSCSKNKIFKRIDLSYLKAKRKIAGANKATGI